VLAKPLILDTPGQSAAQSGTGAVSPDVSPPIAGTSADPTRRARSDEDPGEIADPGDQLDAGCQ
jgi:hypothetical protein